MSTALSVFLNQDRIGRLWLDSARRLVFQYDPAWLGQQPSVLLSLSLPLRPEPYAEDTARPFFANLLPEAEVRHKLARQLGLSERNDYGLLEIIGGDCAGAVSLLPEGALSTDSGEYRLLTEEKLHDIVTRLPTRPLLAGEEGVRLSLAGAQDKLPVYVDNGQVFLPLGAYPSSHILKTPIRDLIGTVENEAYCMAFAARMGVAVPAAWVRRGQDRLYLVERFDRQCNTQGHLVRLHQEDFCQALGVPPDMKYEKEGGPSLRLCAQLIRQHSLRPAADLKALLGWVIFNYLIGNADAHGKNLSFLLMAEGVSLAPFYDLLCTAVYPHLTDRLAMRIGGEDRPAWVNREQWERLAADLDIKPKLVLSTLEDMAASTSKAATALAFSDETGIVRDIRKTIADRSRKVLALLTMR